MEAELFCALLDPLEERKRRLDGWSTNIPLGTEVINCIFCDVGWIDRELGVITDQLEKTSLMRNIEERIFPADEDSPVRQDQL